jgi:hypothetical protein
MEGRGIQRTMALQFSNQACFYFHQTGPPGEARALKYASGKNSVKIVALFVEPG